MDNVKMASMVQKLVDSGKSMAEALQEVLAMAVNPPKEERIAWINDLENMEMLQTTMHRAHAKKSSTKKTNPNSPAIARYDLEIETCKARLKILKDNAGDSIESLIKMGAKDSTITQYWIKSREDEINELVEEYKTAKKLSAKAVKKASLVQKTELPTAWRKELEGLGKVYLEIIESRIGKNDQRVVALVKKYWLVQG